MPLPVEEKAGRGANESAAGKPAPLRSALLREQGTLEWYRANASGARSRWRQALDLDPHDQLAAAWLKHTRDAELNQ